MGSPFWVRAQELGLTLEAVEDYANRFAEHDPAKKRHGFMESLKLAVETWQTLADEFTDERLGEALGLLPETVGIFRKRKGITTLTFRQRREKAEGGRALSLDNLTKLQLEDLVSRTTLNSIAALYGVSKFAIRRLCRQWDIRVPSKTERVVSDKTLTDDQKQVVWGMLLGDGHLANTGYFRVSHGYAQYEYLLHCRDLLISIARSVTYEESVKTNGTLCHGFCFRTDSHPWFQRQHALWYPAGSRSKVYPISAIQNLTPLGLAIWFMDDGHGGGGASFALGDITAQHADEVAEAVSKRFGIDTYVKPHSQTSSCKVLAVRGSSLDKFFTLIKEHIPNNLLYKLPSSYWVPGTRPEGRVQEVDSNLFPSSLTDRCKDYGTMGDADQNILVAEVLGYWAQTGFPYHEARVRDLRTLVNVGGDQVFKKDLLKAWQVGQASCLHFQPHYWETPVHGKEGQTPRDRFEDRATLEKSIRQILEKGYVPNSSRLRSFLTAGHNSVSNFRPSSAKAIIERYCPTGGLVWDPCAGWGGRLLGAAAASNRPRYVACEPQTNTWKGLGGLTDWLSRYLPGVEKRVEVHNTPAEDFDPPMGLDLVFTSPPYFNKELYSQEDTQSWVRYPTYKQWLEKFLAPVMLKARDRLKPGGWLVLNIADVKVGGVDYGLVKDVKAIALELGLGEPEMLRYELPSLFGDNREEPVLCWSKSAVSTYHNGGPNLQLVMCGSCGRVTDHRSLRNGRCVPCEDGVVRCQYPGCGVDLPGAISTRKYCRPCALKVDAERAREKRREAQAPKKDRTFVCADCSVAFQVPWDGGRPLTCPTCSTKRLVKKEEQGLETRTKVCAYRHCGREFLDTSLKNIGKFCHEEHRRREKQFRCGAVSDVRGFRGPDPVLDDAPRAGRPCHVCKVFVDEVGGIQRTRCSSCEAKARAKTCLTDGCGAQFKDDSPKNNQRYCETCQQAAQGITGKSVILRKKLDPEHLRLLVASEISTRKMAEILEVPATTVVRHLEKLGLKTKG